MQTLDRVLASTIGSWSLKGTIRTAGLSFVLAVHGPVLAAESSKLECQDHWNTEAQWLAMADLCAEGAKRGDPLSQVATAVHLLSDNSSSSRAKAVDLLRSAAGKRYDDAYYWLGASQTDKSKAFTYFNQAQGTGGMGLLAIVSAAELTFRGEGIARDFEQARRIFHRAISKIAENKNRGIPAPPGTWWSNAKWSAGVSAALIYAPRYGYVLKEMDGKAIVLTREPRPELSDEELLKYREPDPSSSLDDPAPSATHVPPRH